MGAGSEEPMIRLYDYPDCPFCQKVRVVLAEKELEFERHNVDLRKNEQKNPDFLKLNPYGKVPVLVDEDVVVYDSTIINEYLDDEYPNPPLRPENDSAGSARVRLLEDFCDNSFILPIGFILSELHKPEAQRDNEVIRRYQEQVIRVVGMLEKQLEGKEYLVGEFSLADAAFAPRFLILPQISIEIDARFPSVAAWAGRLRARPSVRTLGL
jgi:glutathione S-transferase